MLQTANSKRSQSLQHKLSIFNAPLGLQFKYIIKNCNDVIFTFLLLFYFVNNLNFVNNKKEWGELINALGSRPLQSISPHSFTEVARTIWNFRLEVY